MKFIDLYNRSKNTYDFKYRVQRFKTWCYLMKKEPEKYKVEWDKERDFFKFYEKNGYTNEFGFYYSWDEKDNSNGNYNLMYKYERR